MRTTPEDRVYTGSCQRDTDVFHTQAMGQALMTKHPWSMHPHQQSRRQNGKQPHPRGLIPMARQWSAHAHLEVPEVEDPVKRTGSIIPQLSGIELQVNFSSTL